MPVWTKENVWNSPFVVWKQENVRNSPFIVWKSLKKSWQILIEKKDKMCKKQALNQINPLYSDGIGKGSGYDRVVTWNLMGTMIS